MLMHLLTLPAAIAAGMLVGTVVERLADPPAPTAEGRFFEALGKGDLPLVQSMLEADPKLAAAVDAKGRSAVIVAAFRINKGFMPPASNPLLRLLLDRKPKLSFFEACAVGDTAAVRRFVEEDPKRATAWHDFGWSALHLAAFSGDAATVGLLLDRGAAIDARARTRFRNTPLQVALLPGQHATAALLLERGADPLARQNSGFAPILEAALLGRRDLVDLLLEHGAEINSRADDGRNAVSEALRGGHPELAAYLKSKGAKPPEITANLTTEPAEPE
jgi:uncharacterized protein